jgi:hypothetical protein
MNLCKVVVVILTCAPAVLQAQTQAPALITETAERSSESPVVQAAKRAVAARKNARKAPVAVITDETVINATATLSTSSGGADIPYYPPGETSSAPKSAPASASASPVASSSAARSTQDDGVQVLTAEDSCLPTPSQNTSSGSMVRAGQNADAAPASVAPRIAPRPENASSGVTAPPAAPVSAGAPRESQNAGPNRPPSPPSP